MLTRKRMRYRLRKWMDKKIVYIAGVIALWLVMMALWWVLGLALRVWVSGGGIMSNNEYCVSCGTGQPHRYTKIQERGRTVITASICTVCNFKTPCYCVEPRRPKQAQEKAVKAQPTINTAVSDSDDDYDKKHRWWDN